MANCANIPSPIPPNHNTLSRHRGTVDYSSAAGRLLALSFVLVGCQPSSLPPVEQPDILLITVDSARADRFSFAGPSPVSTPNLDALARDATIFTKAFSTAPITLPAHSSIFTGQNPHTHGVRSNGLFRLPESANTLTEIVRAAGYRTAAFVAAAVLKSSYGLAQGFDHYDERTNAQSGPHFFPERSAEAVVEAALDWYRSNQESKLFMWLHLFDPHAPYEPPEPERGRFPGSPYDAEIAYVDRALGKLFDELRSTGRLDNTLIIFTSDHGESLGEHNEKTHGVLVYDTTLQVPLMIRGPSIVRGAKIDSTVSLIDLMPTILAAVHLNVPNTVEGLDIISSSATARAALRDRYIYSESLYPKYVYNWSALRSVRHGQKKLILGTKLELYDLARDARETQDLASIDPIAAKSMQNVLDERFADTNIQEVNRLAPDRNTREQLAALGYVWGGIESSAVDAPNPRDQMVDLDALMIASDRFYRGEREEALAITQGVVARDPNNPFALGRLGMMLLLESRHREALDIFTRATTIAPKDPILWAYRGAIEQTLGNNGKSLEALDTALALDPSDAASRHNRWRLLAVEGKMSTVIEETTAVLQHKPGNGTAMMHLLNAQNRGRPKSQLATALKDALERIPNAPELHLLLATTLEEQKDWDGAIRHYRRALQMDMTISQCHTQLPHLLMRKGDAQAVLSALKAGLPYVPTSPTRFALESRALLLLKQYMQSHGVLLASVEQFPTVASLWRLLAKSYRLVGDKKKSLESARHANSIERVH